MVKWSNFRFWRRNGFRWGILLIILMVIQFSGVANFCRAEIVNNIEYGQADGQSLFLDVSIPEGEGLHPAVILVHGGGWSGGDKQDMKLLYDSLSEAGFGWFSINYRLAPQYRWPACLEDVQRAVRWVKDHAEEYKADPRRLALLGYSAGGHLACTAAVRAEGDQILQAVVLLAAPTDLQTDSDRRGGFSPSLQNLFGLPAEINEEARRLLQNNSPIGFTHSGLPPFLLIHGTEDRSVPYHQSIALKSKLTDLGVSCKLLTIDGAPHRITEWEAKHPGFQTEMVHWLKKTLVEHPVKSGKPAPFCPVSAGQKQITVAADGTGDYTTVQAAIDAVPEDNTESVLIMIQPGTYKERIVVPRHKRFLRFRGDDPFTTRLTFNLYASIKDEKGEEIGTFRTPSVTIEADDFTAENITFENSAGPVGQAVAVAVLGDRVVFRNCRFLGWQDTLLDQTGRHYYEDCFIAGHCDYIFGGGTAFFERCQLHNIEASYITAASTPPDQPFGYVFSNCTITGKPTGRYKTYLGRPWRDHANVIFLNCRMEDIIRPEGWHNWGQPNREKTAYYAEYHCTGPGADTSKRVAWSHQLTDNEAAAITRAAVLSGTDRWNPMTGQVESMLKVKEANGEQVSAFKKKIADKLQNRKQCLLAASQNNEQGGVSFFYSRNGLEWIPTGVTFAKSDTTDETLCHPVVTWTETEGLLLLWQIGQGRSLRFGFSRSDDLVDWSKPKLFGFMHEQKALSLIEPEMFYDENRERFLITWSCTLPGNFFQCYQEPVDYNPRLWFTETGNFEEFAPEKIFYEPGYSIKNALLFKCSNGYALVYTDARSRFETLRTAFSNHPTGSWSDGTDGLPMTCRNPAGVQVEKDVLIYYESDSDAQAGLLWTRDFTQWCRILPLDLSSVGQPLESVCSIPYQMIESL